MEHNEQTTTAPHPERNQATETAALTSKQLVEAPMRFEDLEFGEQQGLVVSVLDYLTSEIHLTAQEKGFWEEERNHGEMLMLIVTELAEATEALRHGNKSDDKIPEFSGAEAELADTIIRILDMAGGCGWNVAGAVVAKMEFNKGRAYKHGKEF